MYAMPMIVGGIGRGLMQNIPRPPMFSQHQQMVLSHQHPSQFTTLQTQQQPVRRPQLNPMMVVNNKKHQQQQQQQSVHQQAQQTFPKRRSNAINFLDSNTEVDVWGKDSGSNTLGDKTNTGRSTPMVCPC